VVLLHARHTLLMILNNSGRRSTYTETVGVEGFFLFFQRQNTTRSTGSNQLMVLSIFFFVVIIYHRLFLGIRRSFPYFTVFFFFLDHAGVQAISQSSHGYSRLLCLVIGAVYQFGLIILLLYCSV
jgi:hypothetical protein